MEQYGTLNQGLGKIAQAMASGGAMRQKGLQDGLISTAQADNQISQAMLHQAQARKINDRLDNRAPSSDQFVMSHAGVTAPQLEALRRFQQTGKWGDTALDDDMVKRINNGLRIMAANQAATGDTNASQLMQGMQTGQNMQVMDKALGGDTNALALAKASPIFGQNANGVVLDNYSGKQSFDPSMIAQVFQQKTLGQNAGGGKMPTADIQLVNRLTVPTEKGGVGMNEQQAFAWLQEYKNNPRNAVMKLASDMVANNWMRPQAEQLTMEDAVNLAIESLQQIPSNLSGSPNEPPSQPAAPNYVWTPQGMQPQ